MGGPRSELLGKLLSKLLPYTVSSGLLERYKQVVQTGLPFTDEHQVMRDDIEPYWIVMQVVKLGDGVAVTNRDVTEERAAPAPDRGPERVYPVDDRECAVQHYRHRPGRNRDGDEPGGGEPDLLPQA